ncbi:hypothetical protein Tco_0505976 [Tanacetum coccineum]
METHEPFYYKNKLVLFQVQPKASHVHAVKRIFRYLKGQPTLGLWFFGFKINYLDYGYNFMKTKIHVDNESAICVVKNLVAHSKTKHIEIRFHFIRDSYEKRLIEMVKIHTDYNVADLYTKAFDVTRFQFLITSIVQKFILLGSVSAAVYMWIVTATVKTVNDGEQQIITTVDGHKFTITEASVLRHLQLADADEHLSQLPTSKPITTPTSPPFTEPQIPQISSMPHDSPLLGGYTPGSVEGSQKLNELMDLCTKLVDRVTTLETELTQTKKVYGKAITKLVKKVLVAILAAQLHLRCAIASSEQYEE